MKFLPTSLLFLFAAFRGALADYTVEEFILFPEELTDCEWEAAAKTLEGKVPPCCDENGQYDDGCRRWRLLRGYDAGDAATLISSKVAAVVEQQQQEQGQRKLCNTYCVTHTCGGGWGDNTCIRLICGCRRNVRHLEDGHPEAVENEPNTERKLQNGREKCMDKKVLKKRLMSAIDKKAIKKAKTIKAIKNAKFECVAVFEE